MRTGLTSRPPTLERAPAERVPKPLVLVVDGDRKQAEFRAELLSQAGCTTVVASSTSEALTTIDDLLRLDLVITELHLARTRDDRAGVVVAHRARERFVGIPVVATVGFGQLDAVGEGDRSCFATLLEKGVRNVPELRASIEQLAGLARTHLASTAGAR